jgi:hypothetical protein
MESLASGLPHGADDGRGPTAGHHAACASSLGTGSAVVRGVRAEPGEGVGRVSRGDMADRRGALLGRHGGAEPADRDARSPPARGRSSLRDYSDVVLAVVDLRRSTRWAFTEAWDMQMVWRAHMPTEHRRAMPTEVCMAFVAVALSWGWPRVAALIALGFTAFLRPKEMLDATRRHLVLPQVMQTTPSVWLRIPEPKTRFRWAAATVGPL